MFEASTLGLATAFGAGLVSFLSPCVLPLVPAYVSYVAGQPPQGTPSRLDARGRIGAAALSACFVLGFGTVFVALGASATALGSWLLQYRYQANIVAGVLVALFGLLMLGLAGPLHWLQRDFRFHPRLAGGHPAAAYLLGLAFGFGWTPGIGPGLNLPFYGKEVARLRAVEPSEELLRMARKRAVAAAFPIEFFARSG